jgi:quercetin dioxygenase-like cupin family protein
MNIRIVRTLWMVLSLVAAGISHQVLANEPAIPGMSRQLLLRQPLPPLGDHPEARVIRVHFPTGFKTPLHTHEGPGPRYVLKGKLRVEDNGKSQVYGPGDVFWETGAAMTVQAISGDDAEMIIVELAPAH